MREVTIETIEISNLEVVCSRANIFGKFLIFKVKPDHFLWKLWVKCTTLGLFSFEFTGALSVFVWPFKNFGFERFSIDCNNMGKIEPFKLSIRLRRVQLLVWVKISDWNKELKLWQNLQWFQPRKLYIHD